jgi:DNA-binding transcriptional regulator YiaG
MSTKKYYLDMKSCYGLIQVMSPEQCRAARGWLGWSQQDLAKGANVGISTVKDFESGSRKPIANNLNALRTALETGGIRLKFHPDGSPAGIEADPPKTKGSLD